MSQIQKPLKEQLDKIDQECVREVHAGFYGSRLKIEIGMWQKGKAVSQFRGVNCEVSYAELGKQTERSDHSLKAWNDLYEKYPDYDRFLKEHAEPKAEAWTKKALKGPRPPLPEDRTEETSYANLTLKQLVEMKIESESAPEILLGSAIAGLPKDQQEAYMEYRSIKDRMLTVAQKIMAIVDASNSIQEVVEGRDALLLIGQIFAEDLFCWEARLGELLAKEALKP